MPVFYTYGDCIYCKCFLSYLSCNCFTLSTNKLQCYLLIGLIKLFWYDSCRATVINDNNVNADIIEDTIMATKRLVVLLHSLQEQFEDSRGSIRSHKSKHNIQTSGTKKKPKR